jgi:hypothetical protein
MQLIDLIRIAGITVLFILLWAGSIAFTYWDLHRNSPVGRKSTLWLLLVLLLPLVGFGIYLFAKILNVVLPSGQNETPPRVRRVTALKRPAAQRSSTSTILAADLAADTIANREEMAQSSRDPRKPSPQYTLQ